MRLLLIVSRYPFPPRRGDRLRTVQALRALAPEHEVTVLAPAPPPGAPGPPPELAAPAVRWELYRPPGPLGRVRGIAAGAVSGFPLQSGLYRADGLEDVLRRLAPAADLAILQLVRLAPYRRLLGEVPVLVDLIDSLALSTVRRARFDAPWKAPALHAEARRLERWERRLVEGAAGSLLVCERDRQAVAADLSPTAGDESVRVVPVAVPDGGAGSVSGSPDAPPPVHGPGGPVLAVTGNLGYFPTREGLAWLMGSVWPRLRAQRPELRLVLAGSRLPRRLARRAVRAGAEVVPEPEDLSAVLRRATLALAPMRCGAGQPLKVLEAWAAGVPVVTTSWTAAGTAARPDDGTRGELVVAEGAEGWVDAILALLDDPDRRWRLADAGRARLRADYSFDAVRGGWTDAVRWAAARSAARAARSRAETASGRASSASARSAASSSSGTARSGDPPSR